MILVVRWNEIDETKVHGPFGNENLAMAWFCSIMRRRDSSPTEALIMDRNPCFGRKKYEVVLRYVKGEWK